MKKPKPFAFVLMPFSDDYTDVYMSGIKLACDGAGLKCERVDQQHFDDTILERIYNEIRKADVIIAEMSGMNSNVFYEVGYAHALKKRVILVTREAKDIPFDLKHHQHIVYEGKTYVLREQLTEKLKWCLENPISQVNPKRSGKLQSAPGASATKIKYPKRTIKTSFKETPTSVLGSRSQARIFAKPTKYYRDIFIAGPTLMIVSGMQEFFKKVIVQGGKVRFLIPNPDKDSPATLGLLSHWHTGGFMNELGAALEGFRSFQRKIPLKFADSFEVRYRNCAATLSLVMVNGDSEDGQIQVELLPFNTANQDRPHFVLNPKANKVWYEFFRVRFNQMWINDKKSSEILPSHIGPSHTLDIELFDIEKLKHHK